VNIKVPELSLVLLVGVTALESRPSRPITSCPPKSCRQTSFAPRKRRPNQPGGDPGRIRRARLRRGQTTRDRSLTVSTPRTCNPNLDASLSTWRSNTTYFASQSSSMSRRRSVSRATSLVPTETSGRQVVRRQLDQLRRSMKGLRREGFHRVVTLDGVEEIEAATIVRERFGMIGAITTVPLTSSVTYTVASTS